MKKRKTLYLVTQLVLLVIFAAGGFYFTEKQVSPVQVYQFSRNMAAHSVVGPDDLIAIKIPKTAVTSDFIGEQQYAEAIGKAIKSDVYAGQYVIASQLIEEENINPLELMDLSGYRMAVVSVDMTSGLAAMIKKGDTVDLMFTAQAESSSESGRGKTTYSKIFMQNVLVYETIADNATPYVSMYDVDRNEVMLPQGVDIATGQQSGQLAYLVLAVTPEQALEITTRKQEGNVSVLGRFADSANKETNDYYIGSPGSLQAGFTTIESKR